MPTQVNLTGNQEIDALFWGYKWDITHLTVRFPTNVNEYAPSAANGFQGYTNVLGFQPFNATQQNDIFLTLNNLSTFSGLTFSIENNYGFGNLRFSQATSIDSGNGQGLHVPGGGSAEGNPPDPTIIPGYAQGDTWYNVGHYTTPVLGNFERAAGLMHEIGHAIGLKHGHVTQDAHGQTFPKLPLDHDSQEYSIMTYNAYPGHLPNNAGTTEYPWTYMQNDIAAIQHMYGANYTANAGDNVYTFNPTTGEMKIDGFGFGASYHSKVLLTIWDGDGNDTYDFSNYTTNATVDLNPGEWTTFNSAQLADLGNDGIHFARGNIANALLYNNDIRSMIENAITGSGNDTLTGNWLANVLTSNGGNDVLFGNAGDDTLNGGDGLDQLFGQAGNDTAKGGAGNDLLNGGGGADNLQGEGGNDEIFGGSGNDTILGGGGADMIFGQGGNDTLRGENGNDVIDGGSGVDMIFGGANNDILRGNNGNDTIFGDAGIDSLFGQANDDELHGGAGNDLLTGGGQADILYGDQNDDRLFGGSGNDSLFGGDQNDFLSGNIGEDVLDGGGGNDIVLGDDGNDTLRGNTGADQLDGGGGNDDLFGQAGADILRGNNGNDLLLGGGDNDTLYGQAGNDRLNGNAGNDTLGGGGGTDQFLFDANWGDDTIIDFANGLEKANVSNAGVSAANFHVVNAGGDATVDFGGTDSIVFVGQAGNISTADFIF